MPATEIAECASACGASPVNIACQVAALQQQLAKARLKDGELLSNRQWTVKDTAEPKEQSREARARR